MGAFFWHVIWLGAHPCYNDPTNNRSNMLHFLSVFMDKDIAVKMKNSFIKFH